jgi:hypothetical protein
MGDGEEMGLPSVTHPDEGQLPFVFAPTFKRWSERAVMGERPAVSVQATEKGPGTTGLVSPDTGVVQPTWAPESGVKVIATDDDLPAPLVAVTVRLVWTAVDDQVRVPELVLEQVVTGA